MAGVRTLGPKSESVGTDIPIVAVSALTNLSALQGLSSLNNASRQMFVSMERLSTGKKLNHASDDTAGIQTVDQLKARLATISRRIDTIDFQEHYLGARDGAESVVSDLLYQLKSDVTAAANKAGLTDSEKQALQDDATSVLKTIDYLAQSTTYNGEQILTNLHTTSLGAGVVTRPPQPHDPPPANPNDPHQPPPREQAQFYSILDLSAGGKLNLVDGDLGAAQQVVDAAVSSVSTGRAAIGNEMKSMDAEKNQLLVEQENTESARSQIEDTDYAQETSKLVRAEVLRQAALYVMQLAQKQLADTVLKLIR
jgi:flagellin